MTSDTDSLAALLHNIWATAEPHPPSIEDIAARLIAAGVRVTGIPTRDVQDANQHTALDATPVVMDDYMAGYRQAKSDAAAMALAAPPDPLREAAEALMEAWDAADEAPTIGEQDNWWSSVRWHRSALRAALRETP